MFLTPVGLWGFLDKCQKMLSKLGPSRIFNIMKAPEQCVVLFRVVDSTVGVVLWMAFWAFLAFWVSNWGRRFFWVSIALQMIFIGIPLYIGAHAGSVAAGRESIATAIRFNLTWHLWIFAASLILEIMQEFRRQSAMKI